MITIASLSRSRVLLPLIVALCLLALCLSSCASWDTATADPNRELRDTLPAGDSLPDPRTLSGLTVVDGFSDIEPVADDPQPNLPVELIDADGYTVTVTDTSRILALDLYGSYTKTLIGLGMADHIVGRTVSSTESVLADRPVVTQGGHELNAEAILQLQPTLVIVDHSIGPREAIDQIRAAGVPTVVLEPERSIDSVAEDIRQVAGIVGLPQEGEKLAERSVADIEKSVAAIKDITPEDPLKIAFLYARGNGGVFFILGKSVGTADLIEGVGGVDVATEAGIMDTAPANAEALARLNPDVFIMMTGGLESTGGLDGLMQRPGIAQTTAGRAERIVALPDGMSLAFGPQTGEILLRTALALYDPEHAQ